MGTSLQPGVTQESSFLRFARYPPANSQESGFAHRSGPEVVQRGGPKVVSRDARGSPRARTPPVRLSPPQSYLSVNKSHSTRWLSNPSSILPSASWATRVILLEEERQLWAGIVTFVTSVRTARGSRAQSPIPAPPRHRARSTGPAMCSTTGGVPGVYQGCTRGVQGGGSTGRVVHTRVVQGSTRAEVVQQGGV